MRQIPFGLQMGEGISPRGKEVARVGPPAQKDKLNLMKDLKQRVGSGKDPKHDPEVQIELPRSTLALRTGTFEVRFILRSP
jgi:hypothetical protein